MENSTGWTLLGRINNESYWRAVGALPASKLNYDVIETTATVFLTATLGKSGGSFGFKVCRCRPNMAGSAWITHDGGGPRAARIRLQGQRLALLH